MKRRYYQNIENSWDSIVKLYLVDNWSIHKIARVLFGNEKDYFWRIHRRIRQAGIKKDVKEKMIFVRNYKK